MLRQIVGTVIQMIASAAKATWVKSDVLTTRLAGIIAPIAMLAVVVDAAADGTRPWNAIWVYVAAFVLLTACARQIVGFFQDAIRSLDD